MKPAAMMNKAFFILIVYSMLLAERSAAQQPGDIDITWSHVAQLPDLPGRKQLGVAGPFVGVSNGVLLIAGGSNFPGAKPWNGGKKKNYNDIYMLKQLPAGKFECVVLKRHLARATAYGASVTTSRGIVCIGGETNSASCSSNVFIMQWDPTAEKVLFRALPPLPVNIVSACASSIDDSVYVFGGESNALPVNSCFKLDLAGKHPRWEAIPALPVAMSHSVAVTQSNGRYRCIYVFGGRSATPTGISNLHKTVLCFDPVRQKWLHPGDIIDGKAATNLSAATAVAEGTEHIILIGGDRGNIFHRIESYNAAISKAADKTQQQLLRRKKLRLVTHHPGFSRAVLLYNTITGRWKKLGYLPFYGQVTTTAVKWGSEIFIPGGEIMPGTRTAAVTLGVIDK